MDSNIKKLVESLEWIEGDILLKGKYLNMKLEVKVGESDIEGIEGWIYHKEEWDVMYELIPIMDELKDMIIEKFIPEWLENNVTEENEEGCEENVIEFSKEYWVVELEGRTLSHIVEIVDKDNYDKMCIDMVQSHEGKTVFMSIPKTLFRGCYKLIEDGE